MQLPQNKCQLLSTLEAIAYPTLVFQPPGFHHTFEACFWWWVFFLFFGLARRTHLSYRSGRWCHEVKVFWFLEKTILDWLEKETEPLTLSRRGSEKPSWIDWSERDSLIPNRRRGSEKPSWIDWRVTYPSSPSRGSEPSKKRKQKIGNDVMCLNCVFVCCYLQHFQLESPPEFVDLFVTHLILSSPI